MNDRVTLTGACPKDAIRLKADPMGDIGSMAKTSFTGLGHECPSLQVDLAPQGPHLQAMLFRPATNGALVLKHQGLFRIF